MVTAWVKDKSQVEQRRRRREQDKEGDGNLNKEVQLVPWISSGANDRSHRQSQYFSVQWRVDRLGSVRPQTLSPGVIGNRWKQPQFIHWLATSFETASSVLKHCHRQISLGGKLFIVVESAANRPFYY